MSTTAEQSVPSSGLSAARREEIRRGQAAFHAAIMEMLRTFASRERTTVAVESRYQDACNAVRDLHWQALYDLVSAREETAQAVRAEIEACAVTAEEIGEDAARLECSPAGTTRLIANAIRFRASLPGETVDA